MGDVLQESRPYALLAQIVRKAQGVRNVEMGEDIDVGDEVRLLRDEYDRLRAQLAERDRRFGEAREAWRAWLVADSRDKAGAAYLQLASVLA